MFRENWMRIIALILAASIVMIPFNVLGQDISNANTSEKNSPKFTYVLVNKVTPFTGYLFTPEAVIKITSDTEFKLKSANLDKQYEIQKAQTEYQLKYDTLQITYDSLKKQNEEINKIKDEEIQNLRKIIEKSNNPHTMAWFSGGIGIGIVVTIVLYFGIRAALK